jgi:Tfp pilus assembly protein PilF
MKRLRAWLYGLWLLAFGLWPVLAHAQGAAPRELERLAQAVKSHPNDPDLLFALAQRLAANAHEGEAVEKLRTLTARWPRHRPDAWLLLGRLLYQQGLPADAIAPLEQAVALDPGSGPAHLFLGLALKDAGRVEEAEPHFEAAARESPALSSEAWLLAGLAKLERGERLAGDELLGRAIGADPEGDAANSARLVLEGGVRQPSRLRLQAYGGFEYDSNTTLDSGDDFTGLPTDQSDGDFFWGSGFVLDAVRGERFGVSLRGNYDQSAHLELEDWDSQQFGGTLAAAWQATERIGLRVDGRIAHASLGGDPYLLSGGVRSNLFFSLGPRAGWLRGFGETTWYGYEEKPFSSALERDGFAYGSGLEHVVPVPGLRETSFSWYGSWARFDSEGVHDDLLGFGNAYDRTGFGGGARMGTLLPGRIYAEAGFSLLRELYAHQNLVDALTDNGVGTANPSKRRDFVWETRLRLSRPITRWIELEATLRYADRASNVDLYDYDRWVSGFAVRFETP